MIDAVRLSTHIHRDPTPSGHGSVVECAPDQPLVPFVTPALSVMLAELELV